MALRQKRNVYREDCSCSTAMVAGDDDVRALRDWLGKQRHLPQTLGKYQLLRRKSPYVTGSIQVFTCLRNEWMTGKSREWESVKLEHSYTESNCHFEVLQA